MHSFPTHDNASTKRIHRSNPLLQYIPTQTNQLETPLNDPNQQVVDPGKDVCYVRKNPSNLVVDVQKQKKFNPMKNLMFVIIGIVLPFTVLVPVLITHAVYGDHSLFKRFPWESNELNSIINVVDDGEVFNRTKNVVKMCPNDGLFFSFLRFDSKSRTKPPEKLLQNFFLEKRDFFLSFNLGSMVMNSKASSMLGSSEMCNMKFLDEQSMKEIRIKTTVQEIGIVFKFWMLLIVAGLFLVAVYDQYFVMSCSNKLLLVNNPIRWFKSMLERSSMCRIRSQRLHRHGRELGGYNVIPKGIWSWLVTSAMLTSTCYAAVPDSPKKVDVRVASANSLQITIDPPVNDGGAAITHYKVAVRRKTPFVYTQIGSTVVLGSFESATSRVEHSTNKELFMERLPNSLTVDDTIIEACTWCQGSESTETCMEFKPNEAVLEYFKTGTQANWQTVTDAKVTKGSSVRLIENVWTGTGPIFQKITAVTSHELIDVSFTLTNTIMIRTSITIGANPTNSWSGIFMAGQTGQCGNLYIGKYLFYYHLLYRHLLYRSMY